MSSCYKCKKYAASLFFQPSTKPYTLVSDFSAFRSFLRKKCQVSRETQENMTSSSFCLRNLSPSHLTQLLAYSCVICLLMEYLSVTRCHSVLYSSGFQPVFLGPQGFHRLCLRFPKGSTPAFEIF